MKVQSYNYGTIHGVAQCDECEWNDWLRINEPNRLEKLRLRVKKHVRKTGHKVNMETGGSIDYFIEKNDGK